MPDGDIYECNVDQTFNGQNLTNVLHFAQVGTDGTGTAREALADIWEANYQNPHRDLLVPAVEIVQLRIRKVLPTQTQQFFDVLNKPGTAVGDGLPPQQCAILAQKGTRGGPGGRRGAGHMKISGVPISAQDEGRINVAYSDLMNILGIVFKGLHVDIPTGYTFESVILSMVDSVGRKIIESQSTSRIRTVYSRSIGVGD
jgi:hypothetical protein